LIRVERLASDPPPTSETSLLRSGRVTIGTSSHRLRASDRSIELIVTISTELRGEGAGTI
jgi:hypothetical protein